MNVQVAENPYLFLQSEPCVRIHRLKFDNTIVSKDSHGDVRCINSIACVVDMLLTG